MTIKIKKPLKTNKGNKDEQKSTTKKSGYKRGALGKAIYEYFDKIGVDAAKYEPTFEVAKKILPTTKFNKYHYSWYKKKYRELGGIKRNKA